MPRSQAALDRNQVHSLPRSCTKCPESLLCPWHHKHDRQERPTACSRACPLPLVGAANAKSQEAAVNCNPTRLSTGRPAPSRKCSGFLVVCLEIKFSLLPNTTYLEAQTPSGITQSAVLQVKETVETPPSKPNQCHDLRTPPSVSTPSPACGRCDRLTAAHQPEAAWGRGAHAPRKERGRGAGQGPERWPGTRFLTSRRLLGFILRKTGATRKF